jgi:hypothetical protein
MAATGAVYQVTYVMQSLGSTIENVCHYREMNGLSTPAQIRTAAENWLTIVAAALSNNVLFTNIIIKQMTPLALDETLGPPTTTTHGAVSQGPTNSTIAQIITKRTGVAGKSHRGRWYFGGIPTSHLGDAGLNIVGIGVWTTVVGLLMGEFGPTGNNTHLQFGVYSRSIGGFNPFTVAGWQAITGLDIQPVFGNQRRRRLGVGI